MTIQIRTTKAQIGIRTTTPELRIRQPKGELELKQTKPQLQIEKELPKVKIDQHQCFAEAGLKNYLELTRENADIGYQEALKAVARIAEEGNRMAEFEKGDSAIVSIAGDKIFTERSFNVKFIPQSRPKISWTGYLNINWQIDKAKINYSAHKPEVQYTPGKTEIYLRQRPSLDITYIDEKV